ncbi:MAG TPA: electron transfer flavoprotein subunit alpha/FixB family protein [Pseudonocardia sp.]|jgi:electron transfer flavoprotein alpha subunit|nr:electron transfer flavoprotein subunit alpha/FixB family protein [Pseudonocardia sp.]
MSEVLVLVEHTDGEIKKVTYELLTAARSLGDPAAVVAAAPGTAAKLADSLKAYGAEKIYVAESDDVDGYQGAAQVAVLESLIESADPVAVFIAASADGKEIAGRLAVRTDSALLTDIVGIEGGTAEHSIFGGAFVVTAKAMTVHPIITVRPGAIEAEQVDGAGTEENVEVPSIDAAKNAKVLSREPITGGDRPELTEASIVVSGGRGVGSADNFEVIEKLADSLGAAVGASRAAVDSGYYPNQFQVGQTGKTVSPQLYVALGISGAIQHRAGMQTSKTIIAVNKDAEAPIFEIADFGVVGDLFKVAPQLTEDITKRKS